ncbi:hypothetical protein D9M70_411750 [compost metagenome]
MQSLRAAAHRRTALAALRADSSLRIRLVRYQQHISKARAPEAAEVRNELDYLLHRLRAGARHTHKP